MKIFLRIIFVLSIFFNISIALDFKQTKVIELKKDEEKKILVKYNNLTKLFKFRWTLFKNGGLIIHRSYDKVISQNVLYKRYKNNFFKLELKTKGADYYDVPFVLMKFKEFNYQSHTAIFELFLYDRVGDISLNYLDETQ